MKHPKTSDLFSLGYFEILFGLSESHHLLPVLSLSLSLSLLCCGRPTTPPFARSRARGKFPSGKEGKEQPAAATAFPHRFIRLPSELHFQLLNFLPTWVNLQKRHTYFTIGFGVGDAPVLRLCALLPLDDKRCNAIGGGGGGGGRQTGRSCSLSHVAICTNTPLKD